VCNTLKIENPTSRVIHNAVESKVIKENPRVAKVNAKVRESLLLMERRILRFQLYGQTATSDIDAAGRFCDTIILPAAHRNRILSDDPDDDSRIVVIPKRFSPANRSPSYWLFHSSSTRWRTKFPDQKNDEIPPWHTRISPRIVCNSHFCFF